MRGVLIPGMVLVLLGVAACVGETASSESGRRNADRPGVATLNPARAADRQLLAYGEAHPECRMWTNWEKLCSRTGPGGSVYCNTDPDRRVSPSAPFCAAGSGIEPSQWRRSERASRERFCRQHRSAPAPNNAGSPLSARLCTHQDPERPFNGRRVAALMRPGCDGLADAETGRPFCVRGGHAAAGIPDCAALADARYEHSRWLQCSRWSGEASCRAFPITRERLSGSATAFGALNPNLTAVHGLFCENR